MKSPIKTVRRAKWHRPEDKWQVRYTKFCVHTGPSVLLSFKEKPHWYNSQGGFWGAMASTGGDFNKHLPHISPAKSRASLRRIVDGKGKK